MQERLETLINYPMVKLLRLFLLTTWRERAYWLRALLCLAIGASIILFEDSPKYDFRFQIRGPQKISTEIVLVQFTDSDWSAMQEHHPNVIRPLKEISDFSDSFYWNSRTWAKLLNELLKAEPKVIGISFFFSDYVGISLMSNPLRDLFQDPKIVWAADLDSSERLVIPAFSSNYNSNIGIKNLKLDEDGILRRYGSPITQVPHFSKKLVQIAHPEISVGASQSNVLINYLGPEDTFPSVNLRDIFTHKIDPSIFKNKIVIIGSNSGGFDQMQTPAGRLSRAEVLANITDNILGNKAIIHYNNWFYLILLFGILLLSLWIMNTYPQTVALVIFFWMSTLLTALSIWAFDAHYFFLPVLAPTIQMAATFIVFLSYHFSLGEQRNWRLQEEQRYLSEIETLKSNFVSMMSHDLKTPIAKIQAIVDRWLTRTQDEELSDDLRKLRRFSDELHRYIRSILQISKVEAKDFELHKEVTDINENILRVINRLTPLAEGKDQKLETKLEPIFSMEVDITLIEEVITNLVENAIKYTPNGGRIVVASQDTGEQIIVSVQDNGIGIAPEDQDKVWQKFIRGKRSELDVQGTGLGLYLVKYFVELHGGTVFLESALGKGTQIGFRLPVTD